jgi:hypothetical protein
MSPMPVTLWKTSLVFATLMVSWVAAASPVALASSRKSSTPPPATPASWGGGWGFVAAATTDPKLPHVLLIGDSILNGYRGTVARELTGKANIDVWLNPIHQASPELHEQLKGVLAQGPYDLVHFNMGLHGFDQGLSRIPEDQFKPLTRKLVEAIRKGAPGAVLIWASSTPMTLKGKPTALDPLNNPIIIAHNKMAAQVMEEWHLPINDLYSLMLDRLQLGRGDTVHWKPEGSLVQGRAVASMIEDHLKARSTKPSTSNPEPPSP